MTDRPTGPNENEAEGRTGPTVRDRRRIDPETYQVREPQATAAPGAGAPTGPAGTDAPVSDAETGAVADAATDEVAALKVQLAERLADLQRVQAEYVNYKRRVDRDRDVARSGGVEAVLRDLLSVLDNVRSAREHEELSPGVKAVADELERVTAKHGLVAFGEAGDAFDPHVHDALMHVPAPAGSELTGSTCVQILQPGYKIGERVVRPARVAVAEPETAPAPAQPSAGPDPDEAAPQGDLS